MTENINNIENKMTEENVLIVKYGEIAIRKNNRKFFVEKLLRTIRKKS